MTSSNRQHTTPVLVTGLEAGLAKVLHPVPLGAPAFREDTLQQLLAEHPSLIPIDELEPAFGPLICMGREIPSAAGSLDLLYVSPQGYLTLVETKLWDNPEARRSVVGQIVDYAKEFARWTFDDLDQAVRRSLLPGQAEHPGVLALVRKFDEDIDEIAFIDTVNRNLRRGSFLLLIAGNGIRSEVEAMASYLQQTPSLLFSLALVEFALYRVHRNEEWPVYLQPRIVARTAEVVRAIVHIHAPKGIEVEVSLPPEVIEPSPKIRQRLSEDAFFEALEANTNASIASGARQLINALREMGIMSRWRASSVSMRLTDPCGTSNEFTVVVVRTTGRFFLGWLHYYHDLGGFDPEIASDYKEKVVVLTGVTAKESGTQEDSVQKLLDHQEAFVDIVRELRERLEEEARKRE